MTTAFLIYLGIVFLMSLACFVAYGWDKRRAGMGARRIPERTLQLLALFGGWPGAWMAQRHFRHKTQKASFLIVFWAMVVLHIAVVGSAAFGFAALGW
ncbi:MAG: DUF1294 domain-containing protein [Gemmataceae bacterium]|nr:DUF1294 domain-containing protein [Gemmataceae bacterium]